MPHSASTALGRAFISILSDPTAAAESGGLRNALALADAGAVPPNRVRADLAAAAVLLAKAVADEEGLLEALISDAPVVTIALPVKEMAEAMETVLEECLLLPFRDDVPGRTVFTRLSSGRSSHDIILNALNQGRSVFGISANVSELHETLLRAADFSLTIPWIDSASISLIIEAATGETPSRQVEEGVASTLAFAEIPIAIRIGWSAEKCLERLERPVRQGPSAPVIHLAATPVRIEDLHGFGAAKEWALTLLHDLRAYHRGEIRWADFDTYGLLLSGPPGTGKTAFAAAVAHSAELPLIATSVAEWNAQKYLSGTLSMIRAKFSEARRSAPCVLFVDELDGLGDRAELKGEYIEFWSQIINCVLEEMTKPNDGIIMIGATNLPQRIDPAVLRSGRLDRHIAIGLPDHNDLRGIFRLHLGDDLAEVDLLPLALLCLGSTGADVASWVKRARGRARRARRDIAIEDLLHEVQIGRFTISPDERRRVAIHESGHVLSAWHLRVGKVAGAAIGGRGGTTTVDLEFNGASLTKDVERQIDVLLAGRAAEVLLLGEAAVGSGLGPTSDLIRATQLAVMLETEAGAGEMGLVSVRGSDMEVLRNPLLFGAVRKRLADAATRVSTLLSSHRSSLVALSEQLERRGYLAPDEIELIVSSSSVERLAS